MITRIELTNFMSHAHTVIEPAAGLTVLVGPNNVGKSAVVAALQILCHNENSTYVTRHGAKQCSVKVETDDGHSIEWRRKTSPSYVIDGQTFDRLKGSGQPDELHRALRLPKVDVGNDSDFDVHFGTQKSPIFLLGSSSANAARFFASSSDAIRLVAIQKRHKEKLAEAQREKARLENESKRLSSELELLEPVVELDQQLELVEQAFHELTQQAAKVAAAASCQADLEARLALFALHAAEVEALERLVAPPELAPTEPLAQLIESLVACQAKQDSAKALSLVLAELAEPPSQHYLPAVEQLIRGMESATQRVARGIGEADALAGLIAPPEFHDAVALANLSQRLVEWQSEVDLAGDKCAVLESLKLPPDFAPEAPLAMLESSLATATSAVARWETTWSALLNVAPPPVAADFDQLESSLRQFDESERRVQSCEETLSAAHATLTECAQLLRTAAVGRTCKECGSPLDPDRVIARAATGLEGHDHD